MALRALARDRVVQLAIGLGLAARIIFALFVAALYFGRSDPRVDGDTASWTVAFVNLVQTGTFTCDPAHEYGPFCRLPGYSFVIGVFWLLTGGNTDLAYSMVAGTQIVFDSVAILLFAYVVGRLSDSLMAARVGAGLYATYPFTIVWTPVVYSESLGVVMVIVALATLVSRRTPKTYLIAGSLLGVAALIRPQVLLFPPALAAGIAFGMREALRVRVMLSASLLVGAACAYSPWPIRNYVLQGKVVLTQDLRGFRDWGEDVISFMQYVYSVKAEWEPQFSQILRNQPVTFPPEAHRFDGDTAKLERAIELSKTCGSGFSHWRGYWKAKVEPPGCNKEIAAIFEELRRRQIERDPWRFWVTLPLENLRKAVFKSRLYDEGSTLRRLASFLFLYRTLLILAGCAATVALVLRRQDSAGIVRGCFLFALAVYLTLCAGTSVQMRNIEIRYFLMPDVALLVACAAWLGSPRRPPFTAS